MENLGTVTFCVSSSQTLLDLEVALDKRTDKWTTLYVVNIKKKSLHMSDQQDYSIWQQCILKQSKHKAQAEGVARVIGDTFPFTTFTG